MQLWPSIDLAAIAHLTPIWAEDGGERYHHDFDPILMRHPLLQWFVITRDPAPQSTGRVPGALVPSCDWRLIDDYLKPVGGEQQLSIPYLPDGGRHGTFILSRATDDFRDDDLELAGHLRGLIRGLYLLTGPVAYGAVSCGSADRSGLTATELAVLRHLADGHTAYGIALRLGDGAAHRQQAPRAHLSQARRHQSAHGRHRSPGGRHPHRHNVRSSVRRVARR
ncbi:hypothetical protein [Nocardioides sp. B-3]|uniref:hypothetical protein n=1 Tax=Nocardioides sp. B-3 TaxID=2895565 RepID=UPI0021527CA5|nr:hypothetical protein [Nocardioides sp. B-3]UUZ61450.1 hypothetical protein LP418_13295 [Nocardioides sp. B-3]